MKRFSDIKRISAQIDITAFNVNISFKKFEMRVYLLNLGNFVLFGSSAFNRPLETAFRSVRFRILSGKIWFIYTCLPCICVGKSQHKTVGGLWEMTFSCWFNDEAHRAWIKQRDKCGNLSVVVNGLNMENWI